MSADNKQSDAESRFSYISDADNDANYETNGGVEKRHGEEESVFHCQFDHLPAVVIMPKEKKVCLSFPFVTVASVYQIQYLSDC